MSPAVSVLLFLAGLVVTVKGADWLTDGASALAGRMGVSTLVIGLTVVAFGTSAPELAVSCLAAARGQGDMSIGNVVGSNIFNASAIMGLTALVHPVVCTKDNIRYDVPLCLLAAIVLACLVRGGNGLVRTDGIVLLCLLAVFLSYTLSIARGQRSAASPCLACGRGRAMTRSAGERQAALSENVSTQAMSVGRAILLTLVGLAFLVVGGECFVGGATGIARWLGVSEGTIALTIVAAGTSLPELVTSVLAARKGDTAMALGNVVGSIVLNTFLVLGAAAVIHPLPAGDIRPIDLLVFLAVAAFLWVFCRFGDRKARLINRGEGTLLLVLAVAYYAYTVITA